MRNVGRNLKRLRGKTSLAELARRVGMSPEAISYIERGERDGKVSTLEKLADALGCTVADLVADPRPAPRRKKAG